VFIIITAFKKEVLMDGKRVTSGFDTNKERRKLQ